MQYSNYLSQIAALIKQNPSITVREIASELQFADSKSVYYWLEKANYGGINEFKREVLKAGLPDLDIAGTPYFLVTVPLINWNPKEKDPVGHWSYLHTKPKPQNLFAVRVGTDAFSPWFQQNDVLIISEKITQTEGTWVLLQTPQEFLLAKVIGTKPVNPRTLQSYPPNFTIAGTILAQKRYLIP